MKKFIWMLLALLLALSLVACGGAETPQEDTNDTTDQNNTTTPGDQPEDKPAAPTLTVADTMTVYMNKPVKVEATASDGAAVTYQSTNPTVFTVDKDGNVTGLKPGKAAMTVTAGKLSKACIITVETYEPAAKGKTAEELGVLPVGSYTISLADANKTPVTYDVDPSSVNKKNNPAKSVSLSTGGKFNEFTIVYQTIGENPYYIVWLKDLNLYNLAPATSIYSLSEGRTIHMHYKKSISSNRAYYDDMASGYKWYIRQNTDGTYSFYSHLNEELCLSYRDNEFVAEKKEGATGITSFHLEMKQRGTTAFKEIISSKGSITLRLPIDIERRSGLTDERAQKWANDLNTVYDAFVELTSYPVYQNIIVKAYEECGHIGYVYSNGTYNVISIRRSFANDDLAKMVARDAKAASDFNFCALHEMGHLFDSQVGWYFETEMMTDLKLAYCLEVGGGSAAPSEFPASTYFTFDNIMDCYAELGGDMNATKKYGAYQAAYVMLRIQKQLGWEPFKKTYKWFIETGSNPTKKYEKFFLFVDKLTEYSGKDVRKLFTENEWNTFCEHYGYTES